MKSSLFRQVVSLFHHYTTILPPLLCDNNLLDLAIYKNFLSCSQGHIGTDNDVEIQTIVEDVIEWRTTLTDSKAISANNEMLKVCTHMANRRTHESY